MVFKSSFIIKILLVMKKINGRLLAFSLLLISTMGCRRFLLGLDNNKKVQQNFSMVNLVSDNPSFSAAHSDSSLHNAWGLAWAPSGIAWVNSMSGHVSELYDANGAFVRKGVNIPSPVDSVGGLPTGVVFNGGPGFTLPDGKSANFIFVGVDGVISAWNGPTGNNAVRIGTGDSGSSYTGLTLASSGGANYIYAANFGKGRIDVWDTGWQAVTRFHFHDPNALPGFAPFNIRVIGSWLYVTYAKVGANGRDQAGQGLGFVDIYGADGSWVKRFASGGALNAPWGIEQAPAGYLGNNGNKMSTDDGGHDGHGGGNGNGNGNGDGNGNGNGNDDGDNNGNNNNNQPAILIGNFGDGRINAYSASGDFLGQLASHNHTIVIDGLWAISFPPATATAIDQSRLYFTAGPNGEQDGLFGYLIPQ
jgi:uncharacterized protein (TIGR03118 family)